MAPTPGHRIAGCQRQSDENLWTDNMSPSPQGELLDRKIIGLAQPDPAAAMSQFPGKIRGPGKTGCAKIKVIFWRLVPAKGTVLSGKRYRQWIGNSGIREQQGIIRPQRLSIQTDEIMIVLCCAEWPVPGIGQLVHHFKHRSGHPYCLGQFHGISPGFPGGDILDQAIGSMFLGKVEGTYQVGTEKCVGTVVRFRQQSYSDLGKGLTGPGIGETDGCLDAKFVAKTPAPRSKRRIEGFQGAEAVLAIKDDLGDETGTVEA